MDWLTIIVVLGFFGGIYWLSRTLGKGGDGDNCGPT